MTPIHITLWNSVGISFSKGLSGVPAAVSHQTPVAVAFVAAKCIYMDFSRFYIDFYDWWWQCWFYFSIITVDKLCFWREQWDWGKTCFVKSVMFGHFFSDFVGFLVCKQWHFFSYFIIFRSMTNVKMGWVQNGRNM